MGRSRSPHRASARASASTDKEGTPSDRQQPFQIFIKDECQTKLYSLDVEASDTVKTLKAQIQRREGIPPNEQHLWVICPVQHMKELEEDDRLLSDYNIRSESLVYRLRMFSPSKHPPMDPKQNEPKQTIVHSFSVC